MVKWKEKINSLSMLLYLIMLASSIAIIVYLGVACDVPDRNELEYQQFEKNVVWYDEKDRVVENLNNLFMLGLENHQIYTVISENLPENVGLCFRNKHVLFSAYVGEECIYEQILPQSRFYTNSVGANWVMIPLKQAYAGQRLYVRYKLCYEENGAGFDYMEIGNEKDYLTHVLKEKAISVFLPVIYLVIGFILIILDILINKYVKEKHTLFYLGWIAFGAGSYCLAESQVFPLFLPDQKIMHLVPMLAMGIIPIPAVVYADALFKFKYRLTTLIISLASFTVFFFLMVLNFFDIADYHSSMVVFHIMLLLGIVMLIYAMCRYVVLTFRARKKIAHHIRFTMLGLLVITVCGAVDIMRFWMRQNQEPGKYVRVGFLLFLICFTIASSRQIIDAFKTNTKTELISRLAYEDGLTGLKNRTSYNEAVEEIWQEHRQAGIVMMDVNDLKLVNDTEGHDAGDEMLTYTAEFIRNAFSKEGMVCYRIGGDEFVALVQTERIREDCEEGIRKLEELCREFNDAAKARFKIVIAAGYGIYDPGKPDTLEDVIKMSDSMMYSEKRRMKAEDGRKNR